MQQQSESNLRHKIPEDAVLLIPEPESASEKNPYGIAPGYYNKAQLLELLEKQRDNSDTIQFIADMLETGEPANDGFAELLRKHCADPPAIAGIVKKCGLE